MRTIARLCIASFALLACFAHAAGAVTLGRTLPIYTPTYTVAPDDTFWEATTGGGFNHLDQNGKLLSTFSVTPPADYYPNSVAYYKGRVYVSSHTSEADAIYSWNTKGEDFLSTDGNTDLRMGENQAQLRAFGSAGFVSTGQTETVVTTNLADLASGHPFYPQTVIGYGVHDNAGKPAYPFESCTADEGGGAGPAGSTSCVSGGSVAEGKGNIWEYPADVAAGPEGSFYVLNTYGTPQVASVVLHSTGDSVGYTPGISFPQSGAGSGSGQLNQPESIVRDPITGNLFISDSANFRISEFTGGGRFVESFGYGVADGQNKFEECVENCRAGIQSESFYGRLDINSAGELYAYNQYGGLQVFELNEKRLSSTSVKCTPKSVPVDGSISCTATVTHSTSGGQPPSATIAFSVVGGAVYGGGGTCSLSGTGASRSCHTSFTPAVFGTGTYDVSITASYPGNGSDTPSHGTTSVKVAAARGPVVSTPTITNPVFIPASSGPSATSARKLPIGTTVSFKLETAATVRFTVSRAGPGRKGKSHGKKKCVKPSKPNRHKPQCTFYRKLKGSFTLKGVAGTNRIHFTGRVAGKKLPPGKYRLTITATTAKKKGRPKSVAFRIV